MSNQFLQSAAMMINLHGEQAKYTKVVSGVYDPNTGSVVNTETEVYIKVYRKQLRATQFSYPNLIGKYGILVYMVPSTDVGAIDTNDRLTFGGDTYTIDSYQEHRAGGELCLYRIACVKG